jgi:hypothetical protein
MTASAPTREPATGRPAVALPAGGRHARRPLLIVGALLAVGLAVVGGAEALRWTTGEERADRNVTLPPSVTRLEVSTSSGDLTLAGTSAPQGTVDARLAGTLHPPRLRLTVTGTTAQVSADCGWTFLLGCEARLRLAVPPGVTVVARSSSGDIRADSLRGPFDLRTSSGDVTASGGTGTAQLSTSSGDIRAVGLGATTVYAHTSSGDVSVSLAVPPDQVIARTSAGNVRVAVPGGPRTYAVSAHTSAGNDSLGIAADPSSPYRITASSSAGDVTVTYASSG